jgi:hypothetical protein
MTPRFIHLLGSICLLLTLAACNGNVKEENNTGIHGTPPDTTAIATHSEPNSPTHTTSPTGKPLTFTEQVDAWAAELLPDYKTVDMDPMEAYPKYDGAKETIFRRLRMKNPISNSYGKAVYPRVLVKAYRFPSEAALTKDVEAWLNTLGSTTKNIQLGQSVKAVKSPPLLCAVINNDFLVLQLGCVYEGQELTDTVTLFFEKMKTWSAAYAWQVKCKTGELKYEIGGES